jgi:hypothetical protein
MNLAILNVLEESVKLAGLSDLRSRPFLYCSSPKLSGLDVDCPVGPWAGFVKRYRRGPLLPLEPWKT